MIVTVRILRINMVVLRGSRPGPRFSLTENCKGDATSRIPAKLPEFHNIQINKYSVMRILHKNPSPVG